MKLFYFIAAILPGTLFFTACSPAKKIINTAIAPKDSLSIIPNKESEKGLNPYDITKEQLKKNYINFKAFSAKIKVETEDNNGKNPDITAVVRMVKDSAIWISLTATFLNVEVYRAYITPDSVILLDKREKTVQYRTLDYLQEVTEIPFDFKSLQDMFLGNPIFFNNAEAVFQKNENFTLASSTGKFFKTLLTLKADNLQLLHAKLDDVNPLKHRTADLTYNDYISIDTLQFSTDRNIIVSEKNKISAHLNFKQVDFNKELQLSFSIPKNFRIK